ncbi:MAG: ATP-binding protein, partial [Isosphaeraceae bacterium]
NDRVRGRDGAIQGIGPFDADEWKRTIYDNTRPHLNVELSVLPVAEGTGRLLVMRVPKGVDPPYGTSAGLYKVRVEKSCMPLDPREFARVQIQSGAVDWSALPATNIDFSQLDPVEIARGRNFLRRYASDSPLLGSHVSDRKFTEGLGVVSGGKVTNAGLLLFGRQDVIREALPQHQVHYVHITSPVQVARNISWTDGLLAIIERLEDIFQGPVNPEHELSFGFTKLRVPAFPVDVVREAVLNAVTHRDYLSPNEVLIRHAAGHLTVTSPGGFVGGITPRNILRQEPFARNRRLAEAFEKLRLVERAGMGRDRIFTSMLRLGKKIPEYESNGERVILRLFDGSVDERMVKLIAKWSAEGRDLWLDSLLILTYMRVHQYIKSPEAADLLQLSQRDARDVLESHAMPPLSILERVSRSNPARYHLTRGVARDLVGQAIYTRAKSADSTREKELIRNYLCDYDSINNSELRELLGLGHSNSAKVEASRILGKHCLEGGLLEKRGSGNQIRYILRRQGPD